MPLHAVGLPMLSYILVIWMMIELVIDLSHLDPVFSIEFLVVASISVL